jgi:iron(III) transport system substrate-binding protein
VAILGAAAVLIAGCSGGGGATLAVYTSVTQATVDAVVAGFREANPGVDVEVFRAPTGEINARIAAERREGGLRADVLWLTDPLSMQQYDAEGLLRSADPDLSGVPSIYREERFWGTRILNLVVVTGDGVLVESWSDLETVAAIGGVAIPDPSFAGSAFAALAYFALEQDLGVDFLRRLHDAGATQVRAPGDVVTGVAEGQYAAGITLDHTARVAVEKGSPIAIVWPTPGAIALYSPIAVTGDGDLPERFVTYVLGSEAQSAIAGSGWQPVHPEVAWRSGGPQVTVEWSRAYDRQKELLAAYREIFGG